MVEKHLKLTKKNQLKLGTENEILQKKKKKKKNIPALICESSTNIYNIIVSNRRDKFVSAQDGTNPLLLPSKPNSIERTMEVDPGDELNPEELATAEFF